MNVTLNELRAIADRLFAHLEETGQGAFGVEEDYYWEISEEELYDPSKDPKDLTLGQLSDDWERLRAIQSGEDPPVGYALVWLAAILRNVGSKAVL